MEEINNLAAECGLHPNRLTELLAELIRLREFAKFTSRYRGRLPLKLREAYESNVPARATTRDWVEAGNEEAIDHELHQPDPVRPKRCW